MVRDFAPVAVGMDSLNSNNLRRGAETQRVKHTEYVYDVPGSTGFAAQGLAINPGQPGLFPWLYKIASRYEKYRFTDLQFIFQTEKSTATNGTVIIAVDYDASDDAPLTKTQLLQNEDKERGAPWQKFRLACSKHNLRDTLAKFVRPGAYPGGSDPKTYDLGTLYVATSGMADTSAVGELYVSYEVEFSTPITEETGNGFNNSGYWLANHDVQAATSGVEIQLILEDEINPDTDFYSVSPSGGITMPSGTYALNLQTYHGGTGTTVTVTQHDIEKNGVTIFNTGGNMPAPRHSSPGTSYVNLVSNAIVRIKEGDVITVLGYTVATSPTVGGRLQIIAI